MNREVYIRPTGISTHRNTELILTLKTVKVKLSCIMSCAIIHRIFKGFRNGYKQGQILLSGITRGATVFSNYGRHRMVSKQNRLFFGSLVNASLDLQSKDHLGCNLALNACDSRKPDYLGRLKGYGINITAANYQGKTALYLLYALEKVSNHELRER